MSTDEFDPQAFREFEYDGWNNLAETYQGAIALMTRQATAPLLDVAKVGEASRMLDIACGPGFMTASAMLVSARKS